MLWLFFFCLSFSNCFISTGVPEGRGRRGEKREGGGRERREGGGRGGKEEERRKRGERGEQEGGKEEGKREGRRKEGGGRRGGKGTDMIHTSWRVAFS